MGKMGKDWMKRARKNLLEMSVEKDDFQKARKEWLYEGLEENENCDSKCELCDHEQIRFEHIIKNRLNDNIMVVGSACIEKFTDDFKMKFHDVNGNLVNKKRLKDEQKDYFKKILYESLDTHLSKNPYKLFQNITDNHIKKDGKLTPKQLKCLPGLYSPLDEKGKEAFRNVITVRLKRYDHQEDLGNLTPAELKFVAQFMSNTQKKKFNLQ